MENKFSKEKLGVVSSFTQTIFFLKKFLLFNTIIIIHKILKRNFTRTKEFVKYTYNDLGWKLVEESEYWKESDDLYDFCLMDHRTGKKGKQVTDYFLMEGKLCKTSIANYKNFELNKRIEIIEQFIAKNDEIIEVGCGFGYRLFSFRVKKIANSLQGLDISENSIKAAKKINVHFQTGIKFGILDLTSDTWPYDFIGKTIFSYHVFEQLKYFTEKIILNLIKSKPKQVMHFEPIIEKYGNNLRDITSSSYIKFRDIQDNLLTTLEEFEKKKMLKILNVQRLGCNSNPTNETTFIRWIPTST